jgi:uncharacterized protein (TIGR03437 family)
MRQQRWRDSLHGRCQQPGARRTAISGWNDDVRRSLLLPPLGRRTLESLLLLLLCCAAGIQSARAQAVRTNAGFATSSIPRNDDGSTNSSIDLGFPVNFFGANFTNAWVNNNGNITFGGPLSTFTPEGLAASPLRIIAPFWADVDTRASGSALVTYGRDTVDGHPAFGVNWVNVGYFSTHDDKLNSFQLVLINRSDISPGDFDIEFNYDTMTWETGDASGGSGGLGGVSASAGYSNGAGKPESSFEILGSRLNGIFLDTNRNGLRYRRLNSTVRGRLVFFVRAGSVGCTYGVLALTLEFPWQGGDGAAQVAAPFGCDWTATSSAGFVTLTSGTSGSGSQIVTFNVAPNRTPTRRNATITIAGQALSITQDAFITLSMTPPAVTVSSVEGVFPPRIALRLDAVTGTVDWSASARSLTGDSWQFNVLPHSGKVTAGQPVTLILEMNPGLLPATSSTAAITVNDNTNGPSLVVPLTLDVSPSGGHLVLSQSSFVFRAPQGGSIPSPQSLSLLNSGRSDLSWSIAPSALSSAPWLSFSAMAGVAITGSATPSTAVLSVNPIGRTPGVYQVQVPVTTSGSTTETQLITVTLQVVAPTAAAAPDTSPTGLLFVVQPGSAPPAAQSLLLSNQGAGSLGFELVPSTESGGNWIGLSASSGSIGTAPTTVQVFVNPAGLPTGTYQGRVTANYSPGKAQIVHVVLVVAPDNRRTLLGANACQPAGMALLPVTPGAGTDLKVAFPTTVTARVVSTCGTAVNDATVLAKAGSVLIELLPAGNGLYRGVWTPDLALPTVNVKFTAVHPNFGIQERTITVGVVPAPGDVALPFITTDGVVGAASFAELRPLAPGEMVSIFGSGFASQDVFASTVPLNRSLGGVSVQIGNENAPLYYAGPNQINAQVPFASVPGDHLSIVINSNGRLSAPQTYLITAVEPSLFQNDGSAAALDGKSRFITPQNPARIGDTLQLFATGLGLTDPAVATGAAAPASTTVFVDVSVRIGGVEVPVVYQGLAPSFVGLYQVNVLLPPSLTPGDDVPVVIRQNGIPSNSVSIPLRNP